MVSEKSLDKIAEYFKTGRVDRTIELTYRCSVDECRNYARWKIGLELPKRFLYIRLCSECASIINKKAKPKFPYGLAD